MLSSLGGYVSWCIVICIIILDENNYLKIKTRVVIEIDAQFSSITFDILSWASSEPNESSPYYNRTTATHQFKFN
jgi:hypothetical protein